jgi:hypothetical protein
VTTILRITALAPIAALVLIGCGGGEDDGITEAMDDAARTVASAQPPFDWTSEDVGVDETSVARDVDGTRVVFSPDEAEAIVVGWVSPELPDDAVEPICAEMVRYIDEVAAAIAPDAPFEDLATVETCVATAETAREKTGPMLASLSTATTDGRNWFIGTSVDATTGGVTRLTVNVSSADASLPE